MKKIIITDNEELSSIEDVFPHTGRATIWRALNFKYKSLLASRIRCYAMNFLQSSEYLTTKD